MSARTAAARLVERRDEHALITGTVVGQVRPEHRDAARRLLAKVEAGPGGCWIWTGCLVTKKRYGRIRFGGRTDYTHRASYEIFVGPIPDGLEIDHLCRVHECVNPAHLEAVTRRTNTLRGAGPSAQNARKTVCLHGHPFTEANTYLRPGGGRSCRRCHAIRTSSRKRRLRSLGLAA